MKISLIGASGFIGTRLIKHLKLPDYKLQNIDKRQSLFYPEITTLANVLDKEAITPLLAGSDMVVLLAAEHRDDISLSSLYYNVNVKGLRNVLEAMEANGIKRMVFTGSAAVYGLNDKNPDETSPVTPFNHYGRSKWQAEQVLQEWHRTHPDWNINIVRPVVVFGERNRGNVYNLLKQIAGGKFLMTGSGNNRKSMAYVENVVAFIRYLITDQTGGYNVYNYADKPDLTMNELVTYVGKVLNRRIPAVHVPFWLGMLGGYCVDALAWVTRRKPAISSVRVRKFCATTQVDASKLQTTGFKPPYTLEEGLARTLKYEFIDPPEDGITFVSE